MNTRSIEIPVKGMDCHECVLHVEKAIRSVDGVSSVQVFLGSEKAVLQADPGRLDMQQLVAAVAAAGYQLGDPSGAADEVPSSATRRSPTSILSFTLFVFGAVLFIIVAGEWLGLFRSASQVIPWYVGAAFVVLAGFPIFKNVIRAALRGQVLSHTLMTLGVVAALAIGEWTTAAIVVFFMRIGQYSERFTAEKSRQALKNLAALAPQTARVEQGNDEVQLPAAQVRPGDVVVVRPGEVIPVDGRVLSGEAAVDQSSINGESMPCEAAAGTPVYAASLVHAGSLRIQATATGKDTTFASILRLVEEAEANRGEVQRIADRFSAYYLPVVTAVALLTFLLRRDPLATAAVLVVACSCSFALATPIAILATVGAAAKHGIYIKGGKYVELLAKADVVLVDKTGTITTGQPRISDVITLDGFSRDEALRLAAAAEHFSEHPLAKAVYQAAVEAGLHPPAPTNFRWLGGQGVSAEVDHHQVVVGSRLALGDPPLPPQAAGLESLGKTLLYVSVDQRLCAVLAAVDSLRPEMPHAVQELQRLRIRRVELLTGDNQAAAAAVAGELNIPYQARLLPEDKIRIVKQYQAQGHTVVMVGDGINDAPALAQADVGIAMGPGGTGVANEAAHVVLLRTDWALIPQAVHMAQRTMQVVKGNIAFTAVYNLLGLSLAALGFLPPVFAAAAQSLPDLGILANSSRLIRQ
jgi:Cu+-exporting ATPase